MLISRIGLVAARLVLHRQQPLERAVVRRRRRRPGMTRSRSAAARRATSETRSPSASLISGNRRRLVGAGFILLVVGLVIQQRDQGEIDIALAQRLQRLAAEIERRRGPERIDRIGQQQHLDAARGRGSQVSDSTSAARCCRR